MWDLIVGAALVVQAGYWLVLGRGFARARRRSASGAARRAAGDRAARAHAAAPADPPELPHELPPMSVIVAVRNEEAVIERLLDSLERQSHPHFEVVIVDDGSSDRTREIVRDWTARGSQFRLLAQEASGKKAALTAGVRTATHELLAFTDADCVPPPTWLSTLAREHARGGSTVLIGYSPMRPATQHFARYETFLTGFLMMAAAGLGRPYMAVGRNLSYPRRLFAEIGGFAHSMQLLSGDDDLFVQAVERRGAAEIRPVLDEAAYVPTETPASWAAWIRGKRRHTSAGRMYRFDAQAHLLLFHLTNALTWIAPLLVGWWGAGALALRLGVEWFTLRHPARALGESDLLPTMPFYEILYLMYNVFVATSGVLRKPRTW